MPDATKKSEAQSKDFDPMAALRPLAPATWMSTAWLEAVADMGTEVTAFVADRIQQDVKTQREIMQCKTLADIQKVQTDFLTKAFAQYTEETGKLIDMSSDLVQKLQGGSKR